VDHHCGPFKPQRIAGTPTPPWAVRACAGHETPSCRSW
jgi:hypothetical protein